MKEFLSLGMVAVIALGGVVLFPAQTQARGILDQTAPSWGINQWINLPKGVESLDIGDYKGKVIYFYGFQSWCPGCHRTGFPTLKEVMKHFKGDEAVAFVAVQTTFEGFSANGFTQAKKTAARYDLKIPVGQSGEAGNPSEFMRRYRSGGTPWTVIIGPDGTVRYNDFHITTKEAIALMTHLKTKSE
ncbi:MAG: TlpA disulfide reductase family protein [Verrucomicrobiota bacterium]